MEAICKGAASSFQMSNSSIKLLSGTSSTRNRIQRVRCATNSSSRSSNSYREETLEKFLQEMEAMVESTDRPPRMCTLRAFRPDGEEALSGKVSSDTSSVLFKPLAASVQATAEAQSFETLSGRFAMVAFAVALGVEILTGNSVFEGIELRQLGEVAAVSGVCVMIMAGFTVALGAKNRIGVTVTKGCQDLVEFALTDILDAMFYEDEN